MGGRPTSASIFLPIFSRKKNLPTAVQLPTANCALWIWMNFGASSFELWTLHLNSLLLLLLLSELNWIELALFFFNCQFLSIWLDSLQAKVEIQQPADGEAEAEVRFGSIQRFTFSLKLKLKSIVLNSEFWIWISMDSTLHTPYHTIPYHIISINHISEFWIWKGNTHLRSSNWNELVDQWSSELWTGGDGDRDAGCSTTSWWWGWSWGSVRFN